MLIVAGRQQFLIKAIGLCVCGCIVLLELVKGLKSKVSKVLSYAS